MTRHPSLCIAAALALAACAERAEREPSILELPVRTVTSADVLFVIDDS